MLAADLMSPGKKINCSVALETNELLFYRDTSEVTSISRRGIGLLKIVHAEVKNRLKNT